MKKFDRRGNASRRRRCLSTWRGRAKDGWWTPRNFVSLCKGVFVDAAGVRGKFARQGVSLCPRSWRLESGGWIGKNRRRFGAIDARERLLVEKRCSSEHRLCSGSWRLESGGWIGKNRRRFGVIKPRVRLLVGKRRSSEHRQDCLCHCRRGSDVTVSVLFFSFSLLTATSGVPCGFCSRRN